MLPLAVDWSKFIDPGFVLPLITPLLVGLLVFAAQPGSRQRAKHEADILQQLRETENPNPQVAGAITDLEYVLSNRIKRWAQILDYRPVLIPSALGALLLLGGVLGLVAVVKLPPLGYQTEVQIASLAVMCGVLLLLAGLTALVIGLRRRRP